VFTLPLVRGKPKTVLSDPFSLLITEEAAREYFPGRDPVGRVIRVNNRFDGQITGILLDIPWNTDIHCEFVASYSTLEKIGEDIQSWNQFPGDFAYLLLNENADPVAVESKVVSILERHLGPDSPHKYEMKVRPLLDVHFGAIRDLIGGGPGPIGEPSILYLLGVIAAFILIQAMANYVNLSTARAAERVREVGVRKVFGAMRAQLVRQFLGETTVIALASMLLSLAAYEFLRPGFNQMVEREALASLYDSPIMAMSLVTLVLITGVLAGFYPALYLSRFRPIAVLQGRASFKSTRSTLRKCLVTFQFVIAIGFIVYTTVVYRQIQYVTNMNLGFKKENILILDFQGEKAVDNCRLMKSEIFNKCDVPAVTAASCLPGRSTFSTYGFYPGNDQERDPVYAKWYNVDYDFVSAFGLEIIRGRGFSEDMLRDIAYPVIVNESAAASLEIDNPIGYNIPCDAGHAEVVGVVKDFHGSTMDYWYTSMSIVMLSPRDRNTLAVTLPPDRIQESIAAIRRIWNATLPGEPFDYAFLDEEIRNINSEHESIGKTGLLLALLTTSIACMGILGLVSLTAAQRTKEIGIRKVLGASAVAVLKLLTREFVILIAIANAIAWPISYLLLQGFLQEFPFRVSLGPGTFLLTGGVAILLAVVSSGFQALRAARANPVESLRHE
jgi:putative ABC transport system permease protein